MTVARSYSTQCDCEAYVTEQLPVHTAWNVQDQALEDIKVVTNLCLGNAAPGNAQREMALDLFVWSERFMKMIALADEDIANGRVMTYHSAQDLIDGLKAE
jgi:hypothetical protein